MSLSSTISRIGILAVTAAVVGCSGSVSFGGGDAADAATSLIQGELGEQLDLTFTDATCDEIDDPKEGDTFACTATVDGQAVAFRAEMVADDRVNVGTADLVFNESLIADVEVRAAEILSTEIGDELPPEFVDCGDAPVIVADPFEMPCSVTDPLNGSVFDATLRFDGESNLLGVTVGEQTS